MAEQEHRKHLADFKIAIDKDQQGGGGKDEGSGASVELQQMPKAVSPFPLDLLSPSTEQSPDRVAGGGGGAGRGMGVNFIKRATSAQQPTQPLSKPLGSDPFPPPTGTGLTGIYTMASSHASDTFDSSPPLYNRRAGGGPRGAVGVGIGSSYMAELGPGAGLGVWPSGSLHTAGTAAGVGPSGGFRTVAGSETGPGAGAGTSGLIPPSLHRPCTSTAPLPTSLQMAELHDNASTGQKGGNSGHTSQAAFPGIHSDLDGIHLHIGEPSQPGAHAGTGVE